MKILKFKENKETKMEEGLQDNPSFLRGRDMTANALGKIPAKSNPRMMALLFKREVVDYILASIYGDDPEAKMTAKIALVREIKAEL